MLKLINVDVHHGSICAAHDINIEVGDNETVVIVGPNGAGKTTLLNTIAGIIYPSRGYIYFREKNVTFSSAAEFVRKGIILVPETRELFGSLPVKENLFLGTFSRNNLSDKEITKEMEFILKLFPVLALRQKQKAMTLSGGEQQMLALARGLLSKPRLFLLDEPSSGLAPLVKREIFKVLKILHEQTGDLSILLVEQDVKLGLTIADRGYLMQNGRIVISGDAQKLRNISEVQEIYLGKIENA